MTEPAKTLTDTGTTSWPPTWLGLPEPYYADEAVALYHGDATDLLPHMPADCIVTDPPYGETSQEWDRWPDGWPGLISRQVKSMWCFGSMRMFLDHLSDFDGWRLSQDLVWDKGDGSCLSGDRFMRVHEHALHWYRGDWSEVYHDQQKQRAYGVRGGTSRRGAIKAHVYGAAGASTYEDDGQRLVQSVLFAPNLRGKCLHPTQKPVEVLAPLIAYSCAPGATVLDPFAGSGSTLVAAREQGRRAIGIEGKESYCEVIVDRLQQGSFDFGEAS